MTLMDMKHIPDSLMPWQWTKEANGVTHFPTFTSDKNKVPNLE